MKLPPANVPKLRFLRWRSGFALLPLATSLGFAATFYVAPNGADTNSGAITAPFATFMRAQTVATAGDSVYRRGGTYFLSQTNITATNGTSPNAYRIVNNLTKSGISYMAYSGERPVFDFSNVQPVTNRVTAFLETATNPALPAAAWSLVATNRFDLAGNFAVSNAIPVGLPALFYRIRLP